MFVPRRYKQCAFIFIVHNKYIIVLFSDNAEYFRNYSDPEEKACMKKEEDSE